MPHTFVDVEPLLGLEADTGERCTRSAGRLYGSFATMNHGGIDDPGEQVRREKIVHLHVAREVFTIVIVEVASSA